MMAPKKITVLNLLQSNTELKFVQIAEAAECTVQYVCKLAKETGLVNSNRYVGGYRKPRNTCYLPIIPIEKDEDGRLRPVT